MSKIYYAKAVYGKEEINAVNNVLKNSPLSLMDGKNVKEFEKKIAKIFGKKYGLMVNSGSSANLLALLSLNLKPGSEVITPLLTFSTTVSPLLQLGLIPKFIDVEPNKYIANIDEIKKNITKNTRAIFIPNLLGNVPDWFKIKKIVKSRKIYLIEDSADTIGYRINNKNSGKASDIVTSSFFASHVMTCAGFGGIVCFNNLEFYKKALLLRGWGRSSALFGESESIQKRFSAKIKNIDYDGKYIFSEAGYNFLPSEISAAFGLVQLKKLSTNLKKRQHNFSFLSSYFKKNFADIFNLPLQNSHTKTGWLAFPLTIKKHIKFSRKELQIFLEKKGIQTRTIFTGNILKQPMMYNKKYKVLKRTGKESDYITRNGLLIGCNHGMTRKELNYICKSFKQFILKKKINFC